MANLRNGLGLIRQVPPCISDRDADPELQQKEKSYPDADPNLNEKKAPRMVGTRPSAQHRLQKKS